MYKKNKSFTIEEIKQAMFQSCFNGSMYKKQPKARITHWARNVSILVLMDLCIKTLPGVLEITQNNKFQSLF